MSTNIKRPQEEKLDLLKQIIEDHPFGLTSMDIYKNYKEIHNIGSRNTLKNYLKLLIDREEIKKEIIGNYKVFRPNKPPHEFIMLKLFTAMSTVLKDDLQVKGEAIGRELALSWPHKRSKFMEKRMKKQSQHTDERRKQFFTFFFQQMQKEEETPANKMFQGPLFNESREVIIGDAEATITFQNSKALSEKAWVFYYIQLGLQKTIINELLELNVSVKIESINEKECKFKYKLEKIEN